ncbi:hypothetical protein I6F07_04305 [Ensifer sp. IC4062]|nr:hypothetical protein [Ensifer sp. IC4062]MCA1439453.1 hypothetical protein [Ensifer sp. IC4062]
MVIDDESDFMKNFDMQIHVLKTLQKRVEDAIGRAEKKRKQVDDGEPFEEVFGPFPSSQSQEDQGGGG